MIFYCFLSFLLFLIIPSKIQKIQAFKLTLFRVQRPRREITSIEQLPQELVSNILSRLQAKELVKCKSVCKSWFNLIYDPYFAASYYAFYNNLKQQEEPLFVIRRPFHSSLKTCISLLSCNVNHPKKHVSSELLNPPSKYNCNHTYWTEIMGPCNGIYFLKGEPNVLMNPSLRQFKALPESHLSNSDDTYSFKNYAEFGFDPKTNDYKVIVIMDLWFANAERQIGNWTAELYSLNSNSWRNIDLVVPLPFQIYDYSQVYTHVNNCCYWFGFVEEYGVKKDVVLAFDMITEVFRKIKVPKIRDSSDEALTTLASFHESGTIGVIVLPAVSGDVKCFDVWMMKDHSDEGSWMKRYLVRHKEVLCKVLGFFGSHCSVWNDDSEGLKPSSQQIKDLQIYGKCEGLRAMKYMESLVSLHRGNEFSGQLGSCTSVPDPLPNQRRNFIVFLS
ncbi:F-box/kelch-repeat protein At3g06240-like [Lotus japonicus]|uniref:F-box/kelch-repeat protein At3g06240-like n=1 Tax=Lotus japonicus TaxID=34305 RepID=UPI00258FF5F1|nr:F-box/kelch-repeat protein At3g06240-like [Lotus japonicus]